LDNQRITIKEIASEAGVSIQTVSRVLNNRPDVSAKTRQKIQSIIAKHKYLPSSAARGITQGRSYILGVISASLHYYGLSAALMGVEKHASELGYTIVLRVVHNPETFNIEEHLNFFRSQHVDGIIWTLPEIGNLRELILEKSSRFSLPNIFYNMQPHPNLTIMDFDQRLGVRKAVHHLLQQQANKIGIITGPMTWRAARERFEGWRESLAEVGQVVDDSLIAHGDWSPTSGEAAMRQLMQQTPAIDAVFVSNDHMAMGAMKAAYALGYRVPEDIMLVGFDDIPEAAFFAPPLTTISTNEEHISRFVVDQLEEMIVAAERDEVWTKHKSYLFEPELVIRESSSRHENANQTSS
jgi:LacI family transcriptional regulator